MQRWIEVLMSDMRRCPHCGAEFQTDGQLEEHLQRVHGEGGP
jgi:hypothetical protein